MEVKTIGLLIITVVVISVSIMILYSLRHEVKRTFPENIRRMFESFYQSIFKRGPYNICEAYSGRQISLQEFQTLLLAVKNGQCGNTSASVVLSFSLTEEDIDEIVQTTGITKEDLIFYRPGAKPMGAGALIIEGNPGFYPLKLWDRVDVWQEGEPEPDILIKVTQQGCDPYDDDCDLMCSFKKGICDPYCYRHGQKEDVLCDMDCVDVNKNGRVDEGDFDGVCDLDCYNDFVNPERVYDPDCVLDKDKYGLTGICDPDSNGVRDGICDEDCGRVNFICDPDCNSTVYEGNPDGLKDDDCYTCDCTCNGFCALVCTSTSCPGDEGDPDCPGGYTEDLTECCGNGKCGIGEDCLSCQEDCPPGDDTCETVFDGVCCPEGSNEDYGCLSGEDNLNLTEGEFCYCDNQCNGTLMCTANHCCLPGKFWDGTECSDKFDVLIVALKSKLKEVYTDGQIESLENKIDEYILSLNNDGLGGIFVYLDDDKTYDTFGYKVENPSDWHDIDRVLDQLIPELESKYLLIVGGYNRFPQPELSTGSCPDPFYARFQTDDLYADYDPKDNMPEIPVGRIPDPNNGDMDLLMTAFDTYIELHNSGGLDFSDFVSLSMERAWPGYGCPRVTSGICFNKDGFNIDCYSDPRCYDQRGPFSVSSGHKLFQVLLHGSPGIPQTFSHDPCQNGVIFNSNEVPSLDVDNAVWLVMPCYSSYIKNKGSTSDSVPMEFLKNGGAVYFGGTLTQIGGVFSGGDCPSYPPGGDYYIGTLYTLFIKEAVPGIRIGDAYLRGKINYKSIHDPVNCNFRQLHENQLYGDPTLKIKVGVGG